MLDAHIREFGRHSVQSDRVGRGQAAVAGCIRGLQPERAEARRLEAEPGPELTREHRDRALATGPGDGHDGSRLPSEKPGSDPSQGCARLLGDQEWQFSCCSGARVTEHRHRAIGLRVAQEPAAVGAGTRHRREQVASANLARIEGEAADLDLAAASQLETVNAQRCQPQGSPPAA